MNIVIIGSGNVAAILGRKFIAAGHRIVQVVGRNAAAASALAYEWNTESANYMTVLNKTADVYIVAVSDDAIASVVAGLHLPGKVVAHTAASVSREVLKNVSAHYGILYPLQSLRKEMTKLPDIPVYFDGSDDTAKTKLALLANSISFHASVAVTDEERLKLHVAAVFVSNFVNHLYVLAENYCRQEGLDFHQLVPLIEETAIRLENAAPSMSQTGPALRHDEQTLQKHLEILKAHPHLQKIYELLSGSIQQTKLEPHA